METIYIPLENEGIDVQRPVSAVKLSDNVYLIKGKMPADEEWRFLPGTKVSCEKKLINDQGIWVAVKQV